jgi:SAM-dependent methyltransferase
MDLETYLSKIRNNRYIPTPEANAIYTGGNSGDFLQVGVDTLRSLIRFASVTPASKVLEIGSGMGRIALPLTQWLEGEGEYTGVEIVKDGIAWCQENISTRYERFRFVHLDIHNEFYNPKGKKKIEDLPLPGKHFDAAIFCSVFTHLVESDVKAYLRLLKKHMKDGGLLWGTWFIMDEEAKGLVAKGKSTLQFILGEEKVFFLDAARKSTSAIAYDPDFVRDLLQAEGFVIEHFDKGRWCQRDIPWGGYQELIVARLT